MAPSPLELKKGSLKKGKVIIKRRKPKKTSKENIKDAVEMLFVKKPLAINKTKKQILTSEPMILEKILEKTISRKQSVIPSLNVIPSLPSVIPDYQGMTPSAPELTPVSFNTHEQAINEAIKGRRSISTVPNSRRSSISARSFPGSNSSLIPNSRRSSSVSTIQNPLDSPVYHNKAIHAQAVRDELMRMEMEQASYGRSSLPSINPVSRSAQSSISIRSFPSSRNSVNMELPSPTESEITFELPSPSPKQLKSILKPGRKFSVNTEMTDAFISNSPKTFVVDFEMTDAFSSLSPTESKIASRKPSRTPSEIAQAISQSVAQAAAEAQIRISGMQQHEAIQLAALRAAEEFRMREQVVLQEQYNTMQAIIAQREYTSQVATQNIIDHQARILSEQLARQKAQQDFLIQQQREATVKAVSNIQKIPSSVRIEELPSSPVTMRRGSIRDYSPKQRALIPSRRRSTVTISGQKQIEAPRKQSIVTISGQKQIEDVSRNYPQIMPLQSSRYSPKYPQLVAPPSRALVSIGDFDDIPLRALRKRRISDEIPLRALMKRRKGSDDTPLRALRSRKDSDDIPLRALMKRRKGSDDTPLRALRSRKDSDDIPLRALRKKRDRDYPINQNPRKAQKKNPIFKKKHGKKVLEAMAAKSPVSKRTRSKK